MKIILIVFVFIINVGCSTLYNKKSITEQLSCEEEAKPKSLQALEQQYRCTSHLNEDR